MSEIVPAGIKAKEIVIAQTAVIAEDAVICALDGGPADRVVIGDHARIARGFTAYARELAIGDWCTIHGPVKIYGYETCRIGECTWIAQDVALNCSAPLVIGRGCVISRWTHFTGGDFVQGCRYHEFKECVLCDDVWIGVGATIAPITAGARSMALANAAVTKDMLPNHVYGGVPAVDLTDKLGAPYEAIDDAEKLSRLQKRLQEFWIESKTKDAPFTENMIKVTASSLDGPVVEAEGVSVFNVTTRTYSKNGSPCETEFMQFLLPHVKFFARVR